MLHKMKKKLLFSTIANRLAVNTTQRHGEKMSTRLDGRALLEEARIAASRGLSLSASAKELNLNIATYRNRLMAAAMKHQEVIPNFSRKGTAKSLNFKAAVSASGQAGRGLRLKIDHDALHSMGWNAGSQLTVTKKGKKLILQEA